MRTLAPFRFARILVAAFALAACGGSASTAATSAALTPAPRRDRATITADEMADSHMNNLYEVIQHLHPEWLTVHRTSLSSAASTVDVQVYLDAQHAGNTDILRQLAANSAMSMHYFTASEAEARFGSGNLNGVIQVAVTKR